MHKQKGEQTTVVTIIVFNSGWGGGELRYARYFTLHNILYTEYQIKGKKNIKNISVVSASSSVHYVDSLQKFICLGFMPQKCFCFICVYLIQAFS